MAAQFTNKDPSQILTSVVEHLSMATSLSAITKIVAEAARALTGSDGATFVLKDEDKCYYVDEDAISPLWRGKKFPAETCISGWCIANKEIVLIPDIYIDARIPYDAYRPTFVKSLCMIPIRAENPMGCIGNYWSRQHIPSPEDLKMLQILANSAAVALENLELKQIVHLRNEEHSGLEDRTRELEAALHSMAHDLKSPVAAMTGLAEMLRIRCMNKLDERTYRYVQSIIDTGRRAATQIERLLSLYRVTNGQIDKQDIDLTKMANIIVMQMRTQFSDRTVETKIDPNLKTFGDPWLMHLVLENLFSNAFKYSAKKPSIVIHFGCSEASPQYNTFFVQDHGDGFDPNLADKLFRPLSRLHTSSDFSGTGLGLASVAKIIELHGGKVRAESQPSQGATFFFSLPPHLPQIAN